MTRRQRNHTLLWALGIGAVVVMTLVGWACNTAAKALSVSREATSECRQHAAGDDERHAAILREFKAAQTHRSRIEEKIDQQTARGGE